MTGWRKSPTRGDGAQQEALDIERPEHLTAYLRKASKISSDERVVISKLAGGISNRTVLVERPETGEAWVVKQALPKLRVEVDWFSDPERIHSEALGLRWLEELAPPRLPRRSSSRTMRTICLR